MDLCMNSSFSVLICVWPYLTQGNMVTPHTLPSKLCVSYGNRGGYFQSTLISVGWYKSSLFLAQWTRLAGTLQHVMFQGPRLLPARGLSLPQDFGILCWLFRVRLESSMLHFYSHPISLNSVTWPHLPGAKKCSLVSVYEEKGRNFMNSYSQTH